MQTSTSRSRLRAMYPSLFARIVNQVGRPWMFDGNRFLPETGTPMRKMDRMRTLFAVCEPDPFAVATCKEKSLTTTPEDEPAPVVASVRTLDMDESPPADRPRPGDVTRRSPGVEESGS